MTLNLSNSGVHVKTWGVGVDEGKVHIGRDGSPTITLTLDDFCEMVIYVLTNTNLAPHDARVELLRLLASLGQVRGYAGQGHRLSFDGST